MYNLETLTTFDTKHRTKIIKTQNTKKMSNTDPTIKP